VKKFTRTKLPALPLADYPRFLRRAEKDSSGISLKMKASKSADTRVRRKDLTEVIAQRKAALTTYLQELLALPEVLTSEEFSLFLDEESPDGLSLHFEEISAVDISLLPEEPVSKTVSKTHEVSIAAEQGQVVVWWVKHFLLMSRTREK